MLSGTEYEEGSKSLTFASPAGCVTSSSDALKAVWTEGSSASNGGEMDREGNKENGLLADVEDAVAVVVVIAVVAAVVAVVAVVAVAVGAVGAVGAKGVVGVAVASANGGCECGRSTVGEVKR